ncbi:MAG: DNA polymerase III subunit beta [Thermoguttaceae bacterium]
MKLTCDRQKLLQAFQTAASVVPARSPKPILQNVKLEAGREQTILTATDLEVGVRVEVPGFDVEASGTVLLPVDRFGSILRESSDEQLILESDGTKTWVRGQRSQFHLPTENPDEFPEVARFQEKKYHKLQARFFRELIRRTVFATETESSRYALGGVLLELTVDGVIGVATDGRRLARQDGQAESVGGHESREGTIVPARSLHLLERALTDSEEEIQIAARDSDVLIRTARATWYTRLVEGRFPRWREVFPKLDTMTAIELTVDAFYKAVRQAAIVTSDRHRGVDFRFTDGKLTLSARSPEYGESQVELPIPYEGSELVVMLDPRFLVEFLKVLDPQATFTFYVRSAQSAVLAVTSDGYSYLVMPLSRE